jgi:hypothetical protein
MQALLSDPERTAVALVSLPEEMPVTETAELDALLGQGLALPRGPVFLNAMPDARFTLGELDGLRGISPPGPPLGPAARAALLQGAQRERALAQAARLRALLGRDLVPLPLLAADRWGRRALERIADAMDGQV